MKKIAVDKLKQHKLNERIYGDEEISQDLLDSINTFGILIPLKIKPDNTIISGHRRWKAAKELGLQKVPVEVITFSSKLKEREAILTYNNQRNKIFSVKMREGEEWKEIEEKKAKERKKTSTGGKNPQLRQNFAEAEKGKSRDKIAEKIKIGSGETYRKAKKVWTKKKEGTKKARKLVRKIDKGRETIYGAYKKIRNKEKREKRKEKTETKLKEFKEGSDKIKIYQGDFQDVTNDKIEDNSIDHIITDPPYPEESLPEWGKLSKVANRVLKPGGFCISYSGKYHLPKVISSLSKNLKYYWQLILLHQGSSAGIYPRNINTGYKPILVFVKPPVDKQEEFITDIIEGSGKEKDLHEWQQGEEELKQVLERFTEPNDLILDPFAGSGTVPYSCLKNNRRSVAIEKDEETYKILKGRVADILD